MSEEWNGRAGGRRREILIAPRARAGVAPQMARDKLGTGIEMDADPAARAVGAGALRAYVMLGFPPGLTGGTCRQSAQ